MKKKKLCNTLGIDVDEGVFYEQPAGEARSKQNIFDYLMKLLLIFGGCMGEMFCLGDSFDIFYDSTVVTLVLLFVGIYFLVMASSSKKIRNILGILASIFAVVLLCANWRFFVSSVGYGYSMVVSDFNSYYGLELPLFEQEKIVTAMGTVAMLMMLIPLCALLAASAGPSSHIRFGVIVFAPYMVLMLSSGHMPDVFPMSLVLMSFFGLMCMGKIAFCGNFLLVVHTDNASQKGLRGLAALCIIVLMTLSGYLGYGLFYPKVESMLGPIRYAVYNSSFRELYDQIRGGYSSGGINGGQLSKNGKLKFNHSIHLIISADQSVNQYTYLKGYVGDVYNGTGWNTLADSAYRSDGYEMLRDSDAADIMSMSYELVLNSKALEDYDIFLFSDLSPVQMWVSLPDESVEDGGYICTPYTGLVSGDDGDIVDVNYLTRSSGGELENVYDAYYCTLEDGWTGSGLDQLLRDIDSLQSYINNYGDILDGMENLQKFVELEQNYRAFVYQYDLDVPDRVSKLREEYEGKHFDSLSDAVAFVQEEVAKDATYTLEPGTCPYGEDFIEYFMYENKEGYCTYFASAAVMIFRCLGIPARFAQGYLVPPLSANQEVYVDDSYAHAWAEIYVDGYGWLPVEVTPGFGGRAGAFTPEMNLDRSDLTQETTTAELEETSETMTLPEHTAKETELTEEQTDITEDGSEETTENPTASSEKETLAATKPSKGGSQGSKGTGVGDETAVSDEGQGAKAPVLSEKTLRVLGKLALVVVLLMLTGAVLYVHHRSRCAARQRRFNQKSNRNGCLSVYRELCKMSSRYYIPVEDDVPAHELSLLYPIVEEETWEQVQQQAREAAFSTHDIKDEQKQLMLSVYRKCCRHVYGKLRFVKKLLFLIWDGYI